MLTNRTALITGCNGGIGSAVMSTFAKNQCFIWAHARKESKEFLSKIDAIKKEYNALIQPIFFDLSNLEDVKTSINTIKRDRPIDILINSAGVSHGSLLQLSKIEEIKNTFEANYFLTLQLIKIAVNVLAKNKNASIINVSSVLGIDSKLGNCGYGASKAAIISATEILAQEFSSLGIRVNSVAPGIINTGMIDYFSDKGKILDGHLKDISLRRMGAPEEVAEAIMFLASEKASYITGQTLRVDGGMF